MLCCTIRINSCLLCQVNRVRATGASISAETAATRLGMFTRRIVHRNNLSSRGVVFTAHGQSRVVDSRLFPGDLRADIATTTVQHTLPDHFAADDEAEGSRLSSDCE